LEPAAAVGGQELSDLFPQIGFLVNNSRLLATQVTRIYNNPAGKENRIKEKKITLGRGVFCLFSLRFSLVHRYRAVLAWRPFGDCGGQAAA